MSAKNSRNEICRKNSENYSNFSQNAVFNVFHKLFNKLKGEKVENRVEKV